MRSSSGKAWLPLAVILALGTAVGVGQHLAGDAAAEREKEERATRAIQAATPAEPAGPTPQYAEGDFLVVQPGTLSLRGRVTLEDSNAVALMYRNPAGALVVCTVEPDAESAVVCDMPDVPLIPQSTRLVKGQSRVMIYGIESMGETPEETEYGAFYADGTRFEGELDALALADDRPQAPAPSATWFAASIDGVSTKLQRLESGELQLSQGDNEPVVVIHDTAHGGPSTGVPRVFIGETAAIVVFQTEAGLSGLRVTAKGAEPL